MVTKARQRAIERYVQLRPVVRAKMRAAMPDEVRARFANITRTQLNALALVPHEGITMRGLADALRVTAATASSLADRLVDLRLVERRVDPSDRRVVRLALTAAGRDVVADFTAAQVRAARVLFDELDDRQVAAWLDVLETLAAADIEPGADAR